jgi:hypothetical protein
MAILLADEFVTKQRTVPPCRCPSACRFRASSFSVGTTSHRKNGPSQWDDRRFF